MTTKCYGFIHFSNIYPLSLKFQFKQGYFLKLTRDSLCTYLKDSFISLKAIYIKAGDDISYKTKKHGGL